MEEKDDTKNQIVKIDLNLDHSLIFHLTLPVEVIFFSHLRHNGMV